MSWNGFPNYVSKPLLGRLKSNSAIPSSNNSIKGNGITEIIFRLSQAGQVREHHLKGCFEKVKRRLNSNVKFRVLYCSKKISFYCNIKDKEVAHLTFPPHTFSIQVKSETCYITGQWGRVQHKITLILTLNLLLFFIIKFEFLS